MRRWILMLFLVSGLMSTFGCHWLHSHGVCDCEWDDYCASRSPWVRSNGAVNGHVELSPIETVPAPIKKVSE